MRFSILFLAVLFIALSGCSDKSSNPEGSQNQNPATGNIPSNVQEMLKKYVTDNDDALTNDWLSNFDSNAVDIACNSEAYSVTFLWGDRFGDAPSATAVTDWSGSLSINAIGSVSSRFTIDFEDGQDSVLITDSPTVTMWASKTSNDLDGISFMVTVRTDAEYFAAPILTFQTGPITLEFHMSDLISLDTFYLADNNNGVAVHSRRIWQNSCMGGTINGQWIKDDNTGQTGHITGYWVNYNDDTLGIISGTFSGPATNDTQWGQFSGTVSGMMLDVVLFEFHGYWYYDDARMCPLCGQGHGLFWGKFVDDMNHRRGLLAGQFGDYSLPPDDAAMPISGYWQYYCPWATLWPNGH